jgi:hypothetical protein
MAIKTFTTGEVLTASDTNTYLANSGLQYITSATVGTTVSSVTITGAFSTTYDSYKIVYSGGVGSTSVHLALALGSTATGYYGGLIYNNSASATPAGALDANAASFTYAGGGNANQMLLDCDLHNPFLAKYTLINASNLSFTNYGVYNGSLQNTTSYTAFTLSPSGGTITGGTITVYGYRKA